MGKGKFISSVILREDRHCRLRFRWDEDGPERVAYYDEITTYLTGGGHTVEYVVTRILDSAGVIDIPEYSEVWQWVRGYIRGGQR